MARQLTTRAQVNGYRFLLRRLEHALVRRDVRMLHDPMRSQIQALLVGTVLGLLVLGGCGVWGLIRPQGSVGDAKIAVSKDGGGNYVVIDGTLHPVLNLASARLITGSSESPASVSDGKLASYPRGPLLGIPGAPGALPASGHGGESYWTVCDTATVSPNVSGESITLTVIGERPQLGGSIDAATDDDAVLITNGGTTFLVYTVMRDGSPQTVRATVDTDSVPVMRALGLEDATPRQMSAGLLNAFPEVDPIEVPEISGEGRPGGLGDEDIRVGSVIKSVGIDDRTSYYVVLRDGVQQITESTAEILRLADRDGTAPVQTVAPGQIAATPTSARLPVDDFPERTPDLVDVDTAGTLCQAWSRGADDPAATTRLLIGRALPLPDGAEPVQVTSADGPGPGVDQVYLRPGTGEYIQVTGAEPDSDRAESRYFVSDVGIRFGVADAEAGEILGLGESPAKAPWSVISLLGSGPSLSRTGALVSHDGVAPDQDGRAIPEPGN
ncbi:type VII secretion protein EccB [Gordonia sp. HNM0687]|uniref:Type VII secretion protein EccB n=1 Tax=Gordonia mangrovi TaxID=2665643 RepID=A0A6L7GNR9_9ACTN|nr:type VII secretion protein EccB [Gordonia mangrovi]MXP20861.1 type VII secretion protein EccB [Gordonia mangrovi]UVF78584.1 type VII secretion protein EccB [Gordonia mangrovi]